MRKIGSGPRAAARLTVVAALLLLFTACQTTDFDPAAERLAEALESGVELAASFKPDDSLRVRYLPPVGSGKPKGEFSDQLQVEALAFPLSCVTDAGTCAPAGEAHSTVNGKITRVGDTYTLDWEIVDPAVAEQVRLEIRMLGAGDAPVCGATMTPECYGYLDIRIVQRGGKGNGGGSSKGLITVPSGGTYQVPFKVLAATNAEQLAELSGQGALDLDELTGSCPATELSLPSQGLQAVGAGLQAVGAGLQAVGAGLQAVGAGSGGVIVVQEPKYSTRLLDVSTFQVGAPLATLGFPKRDVLLIVLDDFGDDAFFLPPEMAFGDLSSLTYAKLSEMSGEGAYSHGALVFYEMAKLVERARGFGFIGFEPKLGGAPFVQFNSGPWGPNVRVQAVNGRIAGDFDTDTAASALEEALKTAKQRGYQHVVVNMSFSVVPCGVLADFARVAADPSSAPAGVDTVDLEDGFTFEDYLARLLEYNSVSASLQSDIQKALTNPVSVADDALIRAIVCPPTGGTDCGQGLTSLVFVAASGNYGLGFPLFPAALQGVVSVGAQGVDDMGKLLTTPAAFSNAAAVLAPGDTVVVRTFGSYGLALKGTSFAAPVVSAFTALDLQTLAPRCEPANPLDPTVSRADLAVGGFALPDGPFVDLPAGLPLPLLGAYANGGNNAVTALCQ